MSKYFYSFVEKKPGTIVIIPGNSLSVRFSRELSYRFSGIRFFHEALRELIHDLAVAVNRRIRRSCRYEERRHRNRNLLFAYVLVAHRIEVVNVDGDLICHGDKIEVSL